MIIECLFVFEWQWTKINKDMAEQLIKSKINAELVVGWLVGSKGNTLSIFLQIPLAAKEGT